MRVLKFLLQKEFRQILRDPSIFRILFLAPMIQLLILPLAADYQIKNINLSVIDHDHTQYSQKLINKIIASGYFKLKDYSATFPQALQSIESDKTDLILEVPVQFERKLVMKMKPICLLPQMLLMVLKRGLAPHIFNKSSRIITTTFACNGFNFRDFIRSQQ